MRKAIICGILSAVVLATLASSLMLTARADDDWFPPAGPLAASAFGDVTIATGDTWYLCAMPNGGVGEYYYKWYQGATVIPGANSLLLPITPTAAGVYTYTFAVQDDAGTLAYSNVVTVTVVDPIVYVEQPVVWIFE